MVNVPLYCFVTFPILPFFSFFCFWHRVLLKLHPNARLWRRKIQGAQKTSVGKTALAKKTNRSESLFATTGIFISMGSDYLSAQITGCVTTKDNSVERLLNKKLPSHVVRLPLFSFSLWFRAEGYIKEVIREGASKPKVTAKWISKACRSGKLLSEFRPSAFCPFVVASS